MIIVKNYQNKQNFLNFQHHFRMKLIIKFNLIKKLKILNFKKKMAKNLMSYKKINFNKKKNNKGKFKKNIINKIH